MSRFYKFRSKLTSFWNIPEARRLDYPIIGLRLMSERRAEGEDLPAGRQEIRLLEPDYSVSKKKLVEDIEILEIRKGWGEQLK